MNKSINFNAYIAIENLESYGSRDELLDYRANRLNIYKPVANFIQKRISTDLLRESVIEVGSGSSALLYEIASRKILEKGLGVELSQSRHAFAELWKKEENYHEVKNVNSDFSDVDMGGGDWGWFVVIDNTFTYLYPEDATYPIQLLEKAYAALRDNGKIIFDFINYSKRSGNLEQKHWLEYPKSDPFSYGLYSNEIINGSNHSNSIFIKRDGTVSVKKELSKVYSLSEITQLLDSCGFKVTEVFSTFDEDKYIASESERLVVVARKMPLL
jgi:SAM-dependent methyltransferase